MSPQVYDHVLPDDICRRLVQELDDPPTFVFHRSRADKTVVETVIHSILKKLGDDTPYVEYWCRKPQLSVPLHVDCDEAKLIDHELSNPAAGHILSIDTEPGASPTWIFEEREMYLVPPRVGRICRFAGARPHAVPDPRDEYLVPDQVSAGLRRFVLLFNTWIEAPKGGTKDRKAVPLDERKNQTILRPVEQDLLQAELFEQQWKAVETERPEANGETTVKFEVMDTLQARMAGLLCPQTTLLVDRSVCLVAAASQDKVWKLPRLAASPTSS